MHDEAPDRDAGPRGTAPRRWWRPRDRTEWLFAGGASLGAALVLALLVAPLLGHRGAGRADLRTAGRVVSPGRGSASNASVVGASARGVGTGSALPAPPTKPAADAPRPAGPALMSEGSPLPVLVVFNGDTITLSGAVPSDAARQRLAALAEASSQTPNAMIDSSLTVDSRVPDSSGVRVIEMNSARFATGSTEVGPDHAVELNRVAALMTGLPNITTLVIGHADQRGDDLQNLKLSQARASAVVEYLVAQGISPDRLSAQGVGDRSPLTQQSDAAGLALNRRTEFVFYGLLAGG